MGLEELVPGNTKCVKATAHLMKAKRKPLSRITAMQFNRQLLLWFLYQFPSEPGCVENSSAQNQNGKTLDNLYLKHDGGSLTSKVPPCSKADLKKMLVHLYANTSCPSDYQDAVLLCLLWYLVGRASYLALLDDPNIVIAVGNVTFLFEEQGLSLFPGTELKTSPMLAMALEVLMQTTHQGTSLTTYPISQDNFAIELSSYIPLLGIKAPTVYSHVNSVLDRIAAAVGVTVTLTSHCVRCGGAQHTKGSGELTARRIFDRGAWNIIPTNKGFNVIFNTSKVDHMDHLFSTYHNLQATQHNINQTVIDVLTSFHLHSSASKPGSLKEDARWLSYLDGRCISQIHSYPVRTTSH
ncbi:hypothetical protein PHPALM_28341 [Phytophthora palmivora]|uniref:Uncharacterized protein n=1 Tax=Phytophthora palmivora TaxID=4796 RepID=A0A2P4XAA5_9STRA|nr:hypothetical protein PHPALM_28341 [Phytophthora palmivora]